MVNLHKIVDELRADLPKANINEPVRGFGFLFR